MSKQLYLIAPAGARRDALIRAFGSDTRAFDTAADFGSIEDRLPGIVLVDGPDSARVVLDLASSEAYDDDGWRMAWIDPANEGFARAVSLGPARSLADIERFRLGEEGAGAVLLDLGAALTEVSDMRHDLSNSLTSALAEVQITLMDGMEGSIRETLETVETQLRRMQRILMDSVHLRRSNA